MSIPKTVYQIKVTLIDSRPPIWRRILVANTTTLSQLHDILQTVMGWTDSHLHMFTIDEQIYGDPEGDVDGELKTKNEARFKLNQLVPDIGFRFRYEYDFGDGWLHDLIVEKILPAEKGVRYPVCIDGANACPPDDVGGIGGYGNFLEAMANPRHPEHVQYMDWIGETFDPQHFDVEAVNSDLHRRRSRREVDEPQNSYRSPIVVERLLEKIGAWAPALTKEQLAVAESLAVRRDMVTLLRYIEEKRPTGTQSTGNLQLKAVREVCAQFVNPPKLDATIGDRVYKLRSEEDVWQLLYLHMLANTGGLVVGGQSRVWQVTSSGEIFLNFIAPMQIGYLLFVWWYLEDWRVAFNVSGLSQGLPGNFRQTSLKHLLELTADRSTPFKPFADRLTAETHLTWPSIDQTFVQDTLRSVIERLVIRPLVGFGVLESEYEMEDIHGSKFSKLSKIRLTPFGRGLLETL